MSAASNQKILVALSGGVDSAVAALSLIREGYDVAGLHMTNWQDDDGYCTAARDHQDARTVCRELGIPLHHVNFTREYREQVFQYFLNEYRAGRTPNPDVLCNRNIKFGACLEHALRLGADCIATGHYARLDGTDGPRLLKGLDPGKDQSYFLHGVRRGALAHTLFPIGALSKAEVRRTANEAGLPVFAKPDSTGICFIGERPFREFLSRYLPLEPGDMETPDGRCVGRHQGLMYYTLGQRQGLGIGGFAGGNPGPWYVAGKNRPRNVLQVVQGRNHPLLFSGGMTVRDLHWIRGAPVELESAGALVCTVKTRYRQPDTGCRVRRHSAGAVDVAFDAPQWAVTPGQYAVFYLGDECLGGGAIDCCTTAAVPCPADAAVTA